MPLEFSVEFFISTRSKFQLKALTRSKHTHNHVQGRLLIKIYNIFGHQLSSSLSYIALKIFKLLSFTYLSDYLIKMGSDDQKNKNYTSAEWSIE